MNQLFKKEDLIGKTIESISEPERAYDDMFIKFTDNSFVVIKNEEVGQGFNSETKTSISKWDVDETTTELVELGIVSKEEYEAATLKEEIECAKREIEREKERKKEIEIRERKHLENLKNKYG